jgi:MFS transporter, DHA1 family, inner membrane transport protein
VFWSVAPVTAAGLVSPAARGRAVASVFAGSSVGIVLGVPGGTLLGQQAGWRVPFVVLAGIGLVAAVATLTLLPNTRPSDSHAATGVSPNRARYRRILITTALTVGAFYTSYTYISAFLTRVTGLPHHAVPIILLAGGVGSTIGLASSGLFYARRPVVATTAPVAALAIALSGLFALGTYAAPAIAFQTLDSIALGTFIVAAQTTVLICAPGNTDIATAWFSGLFNLGIASGPIIGAIALGVAGLRSTALAGALLACAALIAAAGLRRA